ncbi:DUF2591 domain-containing protein [Salmonella enterica subsp. enterica]|nr:DUF2591 domain-containing protein [Salmonella enterica subsp. enterica]
MKNYECMSDFEINKRVFKAIVGAKPLGYPHNADGRSVGNEENGNYRWYDYCNNPADAWPIIDENNITIINDNPSMRLAVNDAAECYNGFRGIIASSDENGLRAAMIVFLKMNEDKL